MRCPPATRKNSLGAAGRAVRAGGRRSAARRERAQLVPRRRALQRMRRGRRAAALPAAGGRRSAWSSGTRSRGTARSCRASTARVVKLDAGMNQAVYHGRPAALISDASGSRVAYANPTVAPADVPAEPLYLSSAVIDEDAVAAILARRRDRSRPRPARPGVLRRPRHSRRAQRRRDLRGGAERDASTGSWRPIGLDRLLGLGLVPATVARELRGHERRAAGPSGRTGPANRTAERSGRQSRRPRLPGDFQRAQGGARPASAVRRGRAAAPAGRRLLRRECRSSSSPMRSTR